MEVVSLSPLRVSSIVWQPRAGAFRLTVVAKATFLLAAGEARLAEEQEDLCEEDNHWNDDAARSVFAPNDFAPFKMRADVLVVGHAFAPRAEPVRSLVARVVVAEIDKALEITGSRRPSDDEPAPFTRMPLRYERAAGEQGTANPVGVAPDGGVDAARLRRRAEHRDRRQGAGARRAGGLRPHLAGVALAPRPARAPRGYVEPHGLEPRAAARGHRARLLQLGAARPADRGHPRERAHRAREPAPRDRAPRHAAAGPAPARVRRAAARPRRARAPRRHAVDRHRPRPLHGRVARPGAARVTERRGARARRARGRPAAPHVGRRRAPSAATRAGSPPSRPRGAPRMRGRSLGRRRRSRAPRASRCRRSCRTCACRRSRATSSPRPACSSRAIARRAARRSGSARRRGSWSRRRRRSRPGAARSRASGSRRTRLRCRRATRPSTPRRSSGQLRRLRCRGPPSAISRRRCRRSSRSRTCRRWISRRRTCSGAMAAALPFKAPPPGTPVAQSMATLSVRHAPAPPGSRPMIDDMTCDRGARRPVERDAGVARARACVEPAARGGRARAARRSSDARRTRRRASRPAPLAPRAARSRPTTASTRRAASASARRRSRRRSAASRR